MLGRAATDRFFGLRVAVLGFVLVCVFVYAARDTLRRKARTSWERPLNVGVVLLELGVDGSEPEPAALTALTQRLSVLEARLGAEAKRYRPALSAVVHFQAFGPLRVLAPPPTPAGEGVVDLLAYTWRQWRYTTRIDAAAGVSSRALDAVIYVVAEPVLDEARKQVEGLSQQGGRIGFARIQLDESTVDLCLFVVAHELMHTLGASDKYGADGRALIPSGLGDPEQSPRFPQLYAEVMARNRVIGQDSEAVPESLDELRVGTETAREIGWLPEDRPQ